MSNNKNDELKPCPLPSCGGNSEIVRYCGMSHVRIRCKKCHLKSGYGNENKLISIWNTRKENKQVEEALNRGDYHEGLEEGIKIGERHHLEAIEKTLKAIDDILHDGYGSMPSRSWSIHVKHIEQIKSILTGG